MLKYFLSLCLICLSLTGFAQGPQLTYYAMLDGQSVVPSVSTNAKGLITLLFNNEQTKVNISGMILHLDGDLTEAWLQTGKKGENGADFIDILPYITGRRVAGDIDVPPGLIKDLVFSNLNVVIRSTLHPDGEIRGQFVAETDLNYRTTMGSDQLVPPQVNTGYAFGGIHYALGSDEIDYAFVASGLSSTVNKVSFYQGNPAENGTEIISQAVFATNLVFGVLDLGADILSFVDKCTAENLYVVIKTDSFPEGEIRGQIRFLGNFNSFAPVNGLQQIPSAPSPGFGLNYTTPNANMDSLTTTVFVSGITPTTAKLHTGLPGVVGPVFADMDPMPIAGLYQKTYALTPQVMADFVNGRMYLNFTTTDHPNGEIRGVLRTNLRKGYAFDLCGSQTVPATSSTALGMAMASVDMLDCYIDYKIIIDGFLGGDPTGGAIRKGAPGQEGDQLYSMPATSPFIAKFHALAAGEGTMIELGNTYMELYTPAYPDGEVRGQIRRGLTCPLLFSGTDDINGFSNVRIYPVPFRDVLHIQLESNAAFKGHIQLFDMLGKTVIQKSVTITEGPQTLEISTGGLPGGVYQVVLEGNGKVYRVLVMSDK